jgi:hypothetical protein
VCDTGIGIPVEHISKIFDRFYQTDNASSSSSFTLGTGIGLAFDGMWRYRFMFYDLPGLLARNPALQHDYQRFIDDELTDTLHGLFVRCADAGLFAIDAADIRPLVINIWLVVKFWYAFEQASHPSQPISEATGRRGVRQVLALLKPYVTATLRPAFIAACARYGEA